MLAFEPRKRLKNGHLMTVWAWARRRGFPALPPPAERLFDVAPNARVLAHCHWQPARTTRPTLIVLHGLEGSSTANTMRVLAAKAWSAAFNFVLLNKRNCTVVSGYSLGGNLALKLAGDYGPAAPASLRGVVVVSPVMDLPRCVDALERPANVIYQWNFVRNLKARMRRKAAAFPDLFSTDPLA